MWRRTREAAYWGAELPERTRLVQRLIAYLDAHRCGKTVDTGWSDSDVEVFRDIWTRVSVDTVQEEHGGGKRVVRVRSRLHTSTLTKIFLVAGAVLVSLAVLVLANKPAVAVGWSVGIALLLWWAWYRGAGLHAKIIEVVDDIARDMGLVRIRLESESRPTASASECRSSPPSAALTETASAVQSTAASGTAS